MLAALLLAGPDAVLSHSSAAFAHRLWGFRPPPPDAKSYAQWMAKLMSSPIEIAVPHDQRPKGFVTQPVSGARIPIVFHRTRAAGAGQRRAEGPLLSDRVEVSTVGGACSTRARTLAELAEALYLGVIQRAEFVMAFEHAVNLGEWDAMKTLFEEFAAQRPHLWVLEEMLCRHSLYTARVESAAEAVCDDLFWSVGLRPERQHRFTLSSGRRVRTDFLFMPEGVVVEVEGESAHPAAQLSRDRDRHNGLVDLGLTPVYYDAITVLFRPQVVVRGVLTLLRKRGVKSA
ncbi:MAG: hypothetical protein ACJ790_08615 [Myxococcaceae bacterium]